MKWKKYILVLSSITALVSMEQVIEACADYNDYDTYPSFFGNTAPSKQSYIPFNFIASDIFYNDSYWNDDEETNNNNLNQKFILKEWQSFVGSNVNIVDIEAVVYNATKENLIEWQKGNSPKGEFSNNTMAQFLSKKSNKNVAKYLAYARDCETNAIYISEGWNDEKVKPIYTNEELKDEGLNLINAEKNDFLKMKYAFQIIRMAFYNKEYATIDKLIEQLLGKKADKSIAFTRILGFKAGAYYKLTNYTNASYYYSKMFDNNDAYKFEALQSFEWSRNKLNEKNADISKNDKAVFDLCINNREKAVIYLIQALRGYPDMSLDLIEKAYKLDPTIQGIDVAINREINKLESNYFSYLIYNQNQLEASKVWYFNIRNYDYNSNNDIQKLSNQYIPYINKLNAFTSKLIADKKTGTPAFWYLTKAYLACMQQQNNLMQQELDNAKAAGLLPNEQILYNTIDLLHTAYKSKIITASIEAEMLPKLKTLNTLAVKNSKASYQFRDFMNNIVAGKYFEQGDTIKGIYAMAHAKSYDYRVEFYSSSEFEDMQGLVLSNMSIASFKMVQNFRAKTNKTEYENWLVNNTYYTTDVLNELEATKYLREYDFKTAAKLFKNINGEMEKYPNPFMPQINDYLEVGEEDLKRTYTKLTFSERMAELQDIIAKNPKDAGALYGYAIALYNISYYGKSGRMVSYFRSSMDDIAYFTDPNDSKRPRFLNEYYRLYTAEQYFNKAAAVALDPEMKAKALWGAAKCWTKRCPTKAEDRDYYFDKSYYIRGLTNPYFDKLKSNLSTTKYVKSISSTCDYYSDYLKKK